MNKKIVVVDDETDLLQVLKFYLEETGYEVFSGVNGQEALDLVRQTVPDLVILDIYLPVINGDEVAKIIKKDEKLKHIPVILISAMSSHIAKLAQECQADDYLAKPFDFKQLGDKIKKLVG